MYDFDPNLLLSFAQLDHTYNTMGVFGALALVATMLINLYKVPAIQNQLPDNFKWDKLAHLEQVGLVFGSSFLVSSLTAAAASMSVSQALSVGLSTGLAALGINETTTAVGKAHASVAIAANPDYQPGIARKIVSAVVPVDNKAVQAARLTQMLSTLQGGVVENMQSPIPVSQEVVPQTVAPTVTETAAASASTATTSSAS